ncbi:putative ATPase [Actinoplanes campanulatus]|uniref:Putative ATPase n=1 Tax=Actinoplanes campanulatus TaxID=113559 RepID=A0A7W5AHI7_9ACTN|nr:hypothetical protein [Actinoplanes campanulatus]MBB3096403.1 putative ATPase [Actinoplanes campanulatus]
MPSPSFSAARVLQSTLTAAITGAAWSDLIWISEIGYDQADAVVLTRAFLADPDRFLDRMLTD